MKTTKAVNEEIESLRKAFINASLQSEEKKLAEKIKFLTNIKLALIGEPREEVLKRQLENLLLRKDVIEGRTGEFIKGRNGDAAVLRKEWYKLNELPRINKQIEFLQYILDEK